jgi:hypothetical protein
MQSLKIKTRKMKTPYGSHYFFLLSKGYNAGKPLEKPCPNCFAVMAESEEDRQKLFWVCYSVWKSAKYVPLLVGSVIPFLRICDIRTVLTRAIVKVDQSPQGFSRLVTSLQKLHKLEQHLDLQQKLVMRIKTDMVWAFFK